MVLLRFYLLFMLKDNIQLSVHNLPLIVSTWHPCPFLIWTTRILPLSFDLTLSQTSLFIQLSPYHNNLLYFIVYYLILSKRIAQITIQLLLLSTLLLFNNKFTFILTYCASLPIGELCFEFCSIRKLIAFNKNVIVLTILV